MNVLKEIVVRPLKPEDRQVWEPLWADYNAFYGRVGDTALSNQVVQSSWDRLMDDTEDVHGLVAELDDVLVGIAHFIFHRNMIQLADTCYMQDLFTKPDTRRLGVGRKLIAAIAQICRDRGIADIYWHTHSSNEAARSLYDRVARDSGFLVYRMDVK